MRKSDIHQITYVRKIRALIQEDYNNRTVYEHLNEKTIQNYFYLYVSNNINVMWYQVNLTQKFSTDLGLDVNTKWNLVPVVGKQKPYHN